MINSVKSYQVKMLVVSMISAILISQPIVALSSQYMSEQDIFFSDGSIDCSNSGGDSTLHGSENLEKIYNYFIGKGYKPFQAAGAVGNIVVESGGFPDRVQGKPPEGGQKDPSGITTGWGLIQWTPGKKVLDVQRAANITGDISELKIQLDVIWWAGTTDNSWWGNSKPLNRLMGATSNVEEATRYFMTEFEKPGVPHFDQRLKSAKAALDQFGDGAVSNGADINANTGCSCEAPGNSSYLGNGKTNILNKDKLKPYARAVAEYLGGKFKLAVIGGWRPPDGFEEHSSGRSLDLMVDDKGKSQADMKKRGEPIFEYLKANAASLDMYHIIWQQTQYSFKDGKLSRTSKMSDRGSLTQNHYDHLHVWFNESTNSKSAPTGWSESGFGCSSANNDGAVEKNAVKTAISYAWPSRNGKPNKEVKPEYAMALKKPGALTGNGPTDCGAFVGNVMKFSGLDTSYPIGTSNQIKYMNSSGKYDNISNRIKTTGDLQPGDIVISSYHTYLWVGDQTKNGFDGVSAEASSGDYTPRATKRDPIKDLKSGFKVYRYIADVNDSGPSDDN